MGILDGLPKNAAETREALRWADAVFKRQTARRPFTRAQKRIFDLLNEGLTLATIAGVTRDELDALLAMGGSQLQAGDYEAAQSTLTGLLALDPKEERAHYLLGVCCQAQGAHELAGRCYLKFLAFDATNPQGYLRLGECFIANGEIEGARGCFEQAKLMAARASAPNPAVAAHADAMLARLPAPTPDPDRPRQPAGA